MAFAFSPQEFIRQKRDGLPLAPHDIQQFVSCITNGQASDAQIGAFAMAALLNGLNDEETVALTLAMRDSGHVLDWRDHPRPIIDKHSTGGVGDNVSLMLAPLVAACGASVPMISGRGLGHTGGTIDKMDAIPGYQSQADEALFRQTVAQIGCAIIGPTANFAPADKRFYAIRDVTATVESIPLITASILSKKLVAGLGQLVMDVKFGNGAFMVDEAKARLLAQNIVTIAHGAGLPATALLTDMNEPLADCAGNGLEVQSAVDFLSGKHQPKRLKHVVLALAAEMIYAAACAPDLSQSLQMAEQALASGRALERFQQMIAALGGPKDFCDRAGAYLPQANLVHEVKALKQGIVASWDTRALGLCVVALGGGRMGPQDKIDLSVGLKAIAPIGTHVAKGDVLAYIHARNKDDALMAEYMLKQAMTWVDDGSAAPAAKPIILERITAQG